MIPKLEFVYKSPAIHYEWIKDNPSYHGFASKSLEEIADVIFGAALSVETAIQPKIDQIFEFLEQCSGYTWEESKIKVYPTFLGPSYSDPLSLKVVGIKDQRIVPWSTNLIQGVLVHELGHNLMPRKLFADTAECEQIMDLVTFRVLDEVGIDPYDYRIFTDTITKSQRRYTPGSINDKQLFNPTVRNYLESTRSIDEGTLDRV